MHTASLLAGAVLLCFAARPRPVPETQMHPRVELSPEDRHRIVVWPDANYGFHGACRETERQRRGELVSPLLE